MLVLDLDEIKLKNTETNTWSLIYAVKNGNVGRRKVLGGRGEKEV